MDKPRKLSSVIDYVAMIRIREELRTILKQQDRVNNRKDVSHVVTLMKKSGWIDTKKYSIFHKKYNIYHKSGSIPVLV